MNQTVHARFNPFECQPVVSYPIEEGMTISEIVRAAPGIPSWFWLAGEVRINGRRVYREQWDYIRPKLTRPDRPIIITLHPAYHGGALGGGGGSASSTKNTFRTVAAIALVAAATVISAGALGPEGLAILGSSFAAGGLGATLTAAGLSLGATLLLATIAPPPAALPQAQTEASTEQKTIAGITGNVVKAMQSLPVVLGLLQYSPPIIAPPYTTLENGVVYAHVIYGLSGRYEIDNILLNGVGIDEFDLVEYEVLNGTVDDPSITLAPDTVIERRNQNALLTNFIVEGTKNGGDTLVHQDNPDQDLPQWQYFKTAGTADEIRIRLFWPAIQWSDITGATAPVPATLPIRVEIRERGTSTWKKMPVSHWQSYRVNEQIRQEIRLIWDNPGGSRKNNPDNHAMTAYYITSNGQTFQYTAEAYFAPITRTDQIPVMTAATTSGVTMSASTEDAGASHQAWRAGDSSAATYWACTTAPSTTPQWLKVDFGVGNTKAIKSYLVAPSGDEDNLIKSWELQGSNDNSNWTTLHTVTAEDWTNDNEITYQLDIPGGAYRYFRLYVTESWDAGSMVHVTDFQLYLHDAPGSDSSAIMASHVNMHDDGMDVYLDPATFPQGEYEVRVKRGFAVKESDFNRANYTVAASALEANFFEYIGSAPGEYQIQQNQSGFTSDTLLESFATVSADYPFDASIHQKGVAMIALRAPSVTIESLSALFHSVVPVYSAAEDWSVDAASKNPAALARHILLSTEQNAEALPGELIKEEKFIEFYEFCENEGHEHNGVMDGLSIIEAYRQVLAAGYGAPDWDGFWSIVWEYDRSGETPVQMFTPANTQGLTVNRTFPRLPHAFKPIFQNQDDDYNIDEASLVYADGYSADNATRIEEIDLPGWTDPTKVAERALFDLRQLYLRKSRYSFVIGVEGLVCEKGDLVRLRHDVISRYHDFSRIKTIERSGGNITGLTLESKVDLSIAVGEIEERMAAGIQYSDRSTTTQIVDQKTVTDHVTFTTPFPDPDAGKTEDDDFILVPGMIVGFGVVNEEEENMVVLWYEYVDELNRRITLVDEARGLHA